ncbi:hypothetical protein [Paraburkholderia panacisoli]|uniref:hypothetical protein n=1 Tax=Paraburkholderia panacisoli TaxID=2603818 RepID=UPI00165F13DF|nr:hypothetical protein [Paraburkholderia panacisoli]
MNRAKTVLLFADADIAGVVDDATRGKGLGARQGRDTRAASIVIGHPSAFSVQQPDIPQ